MAKLAQNAAVLAGDWTDRFWAFKAEVDRRVEAIRKDGDKETKTKSSTGTSIPSLLDDSFIDMTRRFSVT